MLIRAIFKPFPFQRGRKESAESGNTNLSAVGVPGKNQVDLRQLIFRKQRNGVWMMKDNTTERGIQKRFGEHRITPLEVIRPIECNTGT